MALWGKGGMFGGGKVVTVPAATPDAPPIVGVVVPPATNAGLRIFHTAWQVLGGIVVGLIAKKTGYVTTPEQVTAVVGAFALIFATIKNVLVALRAKKAGPVVATPA